MSCKIDHGRAREYLDAGDLAVLSSQLASERLHIVGSERNVARSTDVCAAAATNTRE